MAEFGLQNSSGNHKVTKEMRRSPQRSCIFKVSVLPSRVPTRTMAGIHTCRHRRNSSAR